MNRWMAAAVASSALTTVLSVHAAANIARGRPYTFSQPPTYGLCTDAGDATDLTDGKRIAAKDVSFWGNKGCVGWGNGAQGVAITVDLGKVEPIAGVSYCTAAGSSDVIWPSAVHLFVSDDGSTFYHAGELFHLMEDDLPPLYGTYAVRRLRTRSLRTHGRYVRFHVAPTASYVFVDEVEIERGEDAWLGRDRCEPVSVGELTTPLKLTQHGCYLRVRRELEAVRRRLSEGQPPDPAGLAELAKVRAALQQAVFPEEYRGFRAIMPLHVLHTRVLAVYGRLLGRAGLPTPLAVWHTGPYEHLNLLATPSADMPDLRVAMMRGERRAEVINITNTSGETRTVNLTIRGLPRGAGVQPHQVEYVGSADGRAFPLALVPLDPDAGRYATTVPAGMTRQIWLSFEPGDIRAGEHDARLVLTSDGFTREVRLTLAIARTRFPGASEYGLCLWDYVFDEGWGIDPGNRAAAHDHLSRDPLVSAVWATSNSMPIPRGADAQGRLTGEIDFTRWDKFVRYWPGRRHYFVFALFYPDRQFLGLDHGSPAFDRAVTEWGRRWAEHNRRVLGLKPKKAGILFIDEPGDPTWFRATWHYARAFREGTGDILVFNDPSALHLHEEGGDELVDASDIVCVDPQQFERADDGVKRRLGGLAAEGKQLWFYRCFGPVRGYDPSYYRLAPWHGLRDGGVGGGFWAYHPPKDTSTWNEYALGGRKNFSPLFIDTTSVTGSKQYEAMREGVMDWQYMRMLAQRVAQLDAAAEPHPLLDKARTLVRDLPARLLKRTTDEYTRLYYSIPADQCSLADAARREVLDVLDGLEPPHATP